MMSAGHVWGTRMKRRTNLFSSFTLWLLVLALISWALQANPLPGLVLYIITAGLDLDLLHLGAIAAAFIFDCLIGPIPLIALPLPILAAGAYAVWYKLHFDADRAPLPQLAAELAQRNPAALSN